MIKQRKILIEKYNLEYAMDDLFRELMKGCYTIKSDYDENAILFQKKTSLL